MNERNFRELLEAKWSEGKFLCVGLDSSGGDRMWHIVDATHDLVCAYKPNSAFYEARGSNGCADLQRLIQYIHAVAPNVPVILDAKRGDIGNSNEQYASCVFDVMKADAITVHPYCGGESLEPFLKRKEKGIFVLCRTSNPGSSEFQNRMIYLELDEMKSDKFFTINHRCDWKHRAVPFYEYVAWRVGTTWNKNNNCGLVVGAQHGGDLRQIRKIVGNMPILIPGVGFQQIGDLFKSQVEQVISAARDSRGRGMIINSSRGIIFASSGPDFAEAARRETLKLHELINQYRLASPQPSAQAGRKESKL